MELSKETPAASGKPGQDKNISTYYFNPFDPASQAQTIHSALGGRKNQDGSFHCHCPAHADRNPSLHVSIKGDKLLVNCLAGCNQEAVIRALKDRNLWPTGDNRANSSDSSPLPPGPPGIPQKWYKAQYVAHWTYRDKQGQVIGHVVRFEDPDGKQVIPFFKQDSGGKWKAGAAEQPRPLYGLHKLAGSSIDMPVLIVEGEKVADAAARLLPDYVCITWPGGSKAASKADWSSLQQRDKIYICPDADDPGLKVAREISQLCFNQQKERKYDLKTIKPPRVIKPPENVAEGWDLADAKTEGWTGDQVKELIGQAGAGGKESSIPAGITGSELLQKEFPEPRWAVKGILPEGLNILAGKPKQGKSIISANLAIAITLGGKSLGSIPVDQGAVVYLALEDTPRRLKSRIQQMMTYSEGRLDGLTLFTEWPRMGNGGVSALDNLIQKTDNLRLVIIDTLALFKPVSGNGNSNLYADDYAVVSRIKKLADKHGISILLIHHLRKMASDDVFDTFSGTLGLTGAADGLLALTKKGTHSVLHITGRDVEPAEMALEFNTKLLSWRLLGDAGEVQTTKNKQLIFDALKAAEGPSVRRK
ncbi:MAG: AAA family ATPase [Desulfurivibrionaceae bacterium]